MSHIPSPLLVFFRVFVSANTLEVLIFFLLYNLVLYFQFLSIKLIFFMYERTEETYQITSGSDLSLLFIKYKMLSFCNILTRILLCLFVFLCVHCTLCGGKRTTVKSHFSHSSIGSTDWVQLGSAISLTPALFCIAWELGMSS